MKLKFPYASKPTLNFGNIPDVKLKLQVESPKGFIPFLFLFDTGADVTSFPVSSAEKLGINLDECPKEPMGGYEGSSVEVFLSEVKLRFDSKDFLIPCVFNPNENVPILLGRAGIITRFKIILDSKNKEAIFEKMD